MEKEFCTYNQALRLKALGFDEPCLGNNWWGSDGIFNQKYDLGNTTKAPTYSAAFRWFRKEHQIEVTPCAVVQGSTKWYNLSIIKMIDKKYDILYEYEKFNTYEEAELACLDKLLEIVESKSE